MPANTQTLLAFLERPDQAKANHGEDSKRAGLDLGAAVPRQLRDVRRLPSLVVTVCDRAHEELAPDPSWLHWSIPDPVPAGTKAAFDRALSQLRERITAVIGEERVSA